MPPRLTNSLRVSLMSFPSAFRLISVLLAASGAALAGVAHATPSIVMDARTGAVIMEQDSTRPWYPASLTKLVTAYAALKAVRQGRISLDTPLVVSVRASRMPPSKMGFKPGQEVTLDNALKMLMVKSANDIAITIAEGVGGSVENFAVEMNRVAAELGMRESHFVNPNGLPNPAHVSSARDMAIVGGALYRDFPEHSDLYGIGALRLGNKIIPTHNGIMGRYPGADGMKTGFICASGFNVVASATRGGRRLIAVVLGYPNAKTRTLKAASLFDEGFNASASSVTASALPAVGGGPPDLRDQICRRHGPAVPEEDFNVPIAGYIAPAPAANGDDSPALFFANDGRAAASAQPRASSITAESLAVRPYFEPVNVFVGRAPGWTGSVAGAVGAAASRAPAPPKLAARSNEPIAKPVPPTEPRKAAKAQPKPRIITAAKSTEKQGSLRKPAKDKAAKKPPAKKPAK